MARQAIAKDYASTVESGVYVSGIMVHVWLAAMYEIMKQRTVEEIRQRLEQNPGAEVIVYDLGCGPGHFTNALAQAVEAELKDAAIRVSITGIDKSSGFLEYAHQKSFDLHHRAQRRLFYLNEDVLDVRLPCADIITASGFIHHFAPDERGQVLDKMHSLLVKGGVLIEGDEHPAPYEWFEERHPTLGRKLSISFLYLQVIAAAHNAQHFELRDAEIENFFAEVYRDDPAAPLHIKREQLILLVTLFAGDFMRVLVDQGRSAACLHVLHMFDRIRNNSGNPNVQLDLADRGDFKEPLPVFEALLREHGFEWVKTYDTGTNDLIGSAPVSIFIK